jgi:hypothetical protein
VSDRDEELMAQAKDGYMRAYETQRPLASTDEMEAAWEQTEPTLRRALNAGKIPVVR